LGKYAVFLVEVELLRRVINENLKKATGVAPNEYWNRQGRRQEKGGDVITFVGTWSAVITKYPFETVTCDGE
jgi:hypothetical protein